MVNQNVGGVRSLMFAQVYGYAEAANVLKSGLT